MNWPNVKLQRVTSKVGSGATPRGGEAVYQPAGVPLIRSMNVHFDGFRPDGLVYIDEAEAGLLDHVVVQKDDVLFNITGASIGRVTTVPEAMAGARVNQHVCILRTTDLLLPRFLSYYLSSPQQQALIDSSQNGGTRQAVTKAMLLNWAVPLPAVREQHRIVEILQQADALRQKCADADALAQRILPALFSRLFGDPANNPRHWPSKPIGKSLRLASGGTPSKANQAFWKGTIPWVSPKDMKSVVIVDTEDHISTEAVEGSATSLVPMGSAMIVVRSGILAHSVPVAMASKEMAINQDLKALIPNPTELHPLYLLAWLLSSKQTLLGCVKRGATVHSIDSGKFLSLPFMLPTYSDQEHFAKQFESLLHMKEARDAVRKNVGSLFASTLHCAFTGELTAKWRAAHLKELLAEMQQQAKALNLPTNGRN